MKMTTTWHRDCLKNVTRTVEEKRSDVARMVASLHRDEERLRFYTEQVETALSRGMDGFDGERFLVKRTPKPEESK